MAHPPKQRLLIFVIAYYAESTLRKVLERIPASIFEQYDCEVLVVDDASEDRTFAIGREYKEHHPEICMTVLRNEYNQGYGGNQKIGYAYALAEGFDFVAMVHGDGQYAPEELPRLVAPLAEGTADAVFGSRMMTAFGALQGGMPLYKWVGNRILSTAQNMLLGAKLSEFHSGYRVYSVAALRKIQFRLNSNDFHFDTEIIIQLLNAHLRIQELPIPTYYGDEICRVNGMKYAKDVMVTTLKNVAHRSGLLHQRRFDPMVEDNHHYDLKLGYPSSHSWALARVPEGAKVIDIGAGPGGMAQELVKKGCDTAVVDQYPPKEKDPKVKVFVQDLDQPPTFDVFPYKYLLLLDVIEHLKEPEKFLERLRAQFDHEPKTLVLTTPNVSFVVIRLMLAAGQFNYGKAGILDRTHTRLFTFRSLEHLLRDSGFRIKELRGVPAPFPKVLGDGLLGKAAVAANLALIRLSKSLFSYQILVVAEGSPDVDFLLRDTKARSAARTAKLRLERPQLDEGSRRARKRSTPSPVGRG
ncbi:MAG: bifunctional glycosyltransferase/class I SAM-dependent methyltransferase, partial [Myxococcota bacterium]